MKKLLYLLIIIFMFCLSSCKKPYEIKQIETHTVSSSKSLVDSVSNRTTEVKTSTNDYEEEIKQIEKIEEEEVEETTKIVETVDLTSILESIKNDDVILPVEGDIPKVDISSIYINRPKLVDYQDKDLQTTLRNNVVSKYWTYGKSPLTWTFIEPNKKIVSNYKPNSSAKFSIGKNATSGDKGCYIPLLSKTEENGDEYEGRFFCFEDTNGTEAQSPLSFRVTNKLGDIVYDNHKISDILAKHYNLTISSNGLIYIDGELINILYVDDLDKLLGK